MSFGDAKKKIEAAVKKAVEDMKRPAKMRELGEMAADMIRTRTRLGYGVAEGAATREKLKPLSATYKKARKDGGDLSSETSPGRSNLTRTGQLLDSVGVTKSETGKVTVGPSGKRDDRQTNSEVAEHVSASRPFNNLSAVETKRIEDQVKREILILLDSKLTKAK